MGDVTWTAYDTKTTVLTTQLNSLADGGESALGVEFDNTTDRDMHIDVDIILASLTPTTGAHVILRDYISIDGTNYEDQASAIPYRASITTGAGAKRAAIRQVTISPGKHKFTAQNECNVSFGATGNSVDVYPFTPTVA